MTAPYDVIKKIQATDSKNDKIQILKDEAIKNNDELFEGLRMAYDGMITFGLKQIDAKTTPDGKGLSFEKFKTIAKELESRRLSGDAARLVVAQMCNEATKDQWNNWYRRILIKDMGAGFSEKTVNKAVSGINSNYEIYVFEVQLAEPVDAVAEPFVGQRIINVKYDGMRCISIVYPNGHVEQYSRNGKALYNFGVVAQQLGKSARFLKEPMVIDGEIMSTSFQDLMKQAHRKSDVAADDSVLYIFDMLPLSAFKEKVYKVSLKNRIAHMKEWYDASEHAMPNVEMVGNITIDLDTKEGQEKLDELNKLALKQNYEGLMIKDPESFYYCKRTTDWLKMKPFIEESLTVVRINEGTKDRKMEGTMGSVTCEGVVDGKKVVVDVGSGFSVKTRAQIWADYTNTPVTWKKKQDSKWVEYTETPSGTSVLGDILEVRADCLTKSEDNDTYSMRFPRAKTFRGFEKGEKL